MRRKVSFILLSFSVFLFAAFGTEAATIEQLRQRIEILKHEISLLQSLLANMKLRQGITAHSYIVLRLSDNFVLLQKNSNQTYPIASVTKLMTAVISLENTSAEDTITLTQDMLRPLGYSPSIYLGLNINAANLLKASLIQSTNDAAEALTYFVGKQKFLELMNQKAKELGMTSTVFKDAHGLSSQNLSSASDLAKLIAYIHKNNPEVLEITKNNDFWLPDIKGDLLKFRNVNDFYPLGEFLGGKTGYLLRAKQTFAGVFNVGKEPLAIVILYSQNRQADIFAILRQLRN